MPGVRPLAAALSVATLVAWPAPTRWLPPVAATLLVGAVALLSVLAVTRGF